MILRRTNVPSFQFLGLGLGASLLLLAGCATPGRPVGVTSPPPPVIGSAPIAAYDAYALVLAGPPSEQVAVVAGPRFERVETIALAAGN